MRTAGLGRAVALVFAAVGAGCPSMSHMHTARTLPPGVVQYSAAVGAYAFEADGDGVEDEVLPFADAGLRRGFTDRVDAGLRLTAFSMIQGDVNVQLHESPSLAVSVDPTVSWLPAPIFLAYLWLPILVDFDLSPRTTVTLSARVGYAYTDDLDSTDYGIEKKTALAGFGVGLAHRPGGRSTILPEVHVVYPTDGRPSEDAIYSLSLGFLW